MGSGDVSTKTPSNPTIYLKAAVSILIYCALGYSLVAVAENACVNSLGICNDITGWLVFFAYVLVPIVCGFNLYRFGKTTLQSFVFLVIALIAYVVAIFAAIVSFVLPQL